jgi:hypothetical protein
MQQVIKRFLWMSGLVLGLQSAWGFALLGPAPEAPGPGGTGSARGDSWQTPDIFYNPIGSWDGAPIGPKNLGEGYRRNSPALYYACDASFLDYFGSNGLAAVDGAFDIMNNAFTNNPLTGQYFTNGVDSFSPDLSEFPLDSQGINYKAQGVGLLDVKSLTLHLLMEQVGLINPVRYIWTLHSRYIIPGGSCAAGAMEYLVVQRNFDIINSPLNRIQYSSYVNDTLYSYIIAEYCDGQHSPFGPQAVLSDAVEFPVDPLATVFTPVAAGDGGWLIDNPPDSSFRPTIFIANALYPYGFGLAPGGFYNGLTRDDMAGLRYLLTTNNVNFESAAAGSVLLSSTSGGGNGLGPPFLLYTSNYTAFASAALTNPPATLITLFPGLVVASSTFTFTNIATPNVVAYYTNNFVLGNPPVLVIVTNGYNNTQLTIYSDVFANLVITNGSNGFLTNNIRPNTSAQLVTVQVNQGGVLGNPLTTNISFQSITLSNVPSGEYYIDTNYTCGPTVILYPVFTNVVATTNVIVTASNAAGYFYSQSIVTYSTTHVFAAQSPVCATVSTGTVANATGLFQGIEKIYFQKSTYDSLIGQYYQPITNYYTNILVSGGKTSTSQFRRVVTTPDILFRAEDMSGPLPFFATFDRNTGVFNDANRLPGLAGPGTIDPPSVIVYNKVGDVFIQGPIGTTNAFLNEDPSSSLLAWGSFDGTTNDPVVYPNGTSIQNLQNMILVQLSIAPATNVNYTATPPLLTYATNMTFSVAGGAFVPPFTWSATGLPPGLSVTTANSVGRLSGVPAQHGTFDNVTLTLTDVISRSTQWSFSITIP